MAAAAHFTANVYGLAEGNQPFQNAAGATAFSRVIEFPKPTSQSLPTTGTVIHSLPNGFQVNNLNGSFYVYSVIEVFPTGLNQHSNKLLSDQSASTLATNAG